MEKDPYTELGEDALELILFAENHGPLNADRERILRLLMGDYERGNYSTYRASLLWKQHLNRQRQAYRHTMKAPMFFVALSAEDQEPTRIEFAELVEWLEKHERILIENGEYDHLRKQRGFSGRRIKLRAEARKRQEKIRWQPVRT
jgi:hypothetical protein